MKKTQTILLLIVFSSIILFSGFKFGKSAQKQSPGIDISQLTLIDGKYKGVGTGFRPGLSVEITIKDGKILKVDILRHHEIGPQYWQRAMKIIPKVIVDKQSTGVDVIGGATFTSNGIKAAVEDALKKAVPGDDTSH